MMWQGKANFKLTTTSKLLDRSTVRGRNLVTRPTAQTVQNVAKLDCRILIRAKTTGSWLPARSTTVTGTVLSTMEYRDFLFARYNLNPPNLQKMLWLFPILLRLSCIWLVIAHNNEVCDKFVHPAKSTFQQNCAHIEPSYASHRWELPGNYPVFTLLMVFYHYLERIWRILVTPVFV